MNGTDLSVFLMLLTGALCVLWQKKRQFDRTTPAGIELFPIFVRKITGRIFDAILQGLGYGLLFGGFLVWAMAYQIAWVGITLLLLFGFLIEKDFYRSK